MDKNYFQGLEIYFRSFEIYFSAFEIYFRATEKVLCRAAWLFAQSGLEFSSKQQSILCRAAWNFVPSLKSTRSLYGRSFPKGGRKAAKAREAGHNTLINYNKCAAMVGYSVKSRTFARIYTLEQNK
ncbi:MAG: hypothetical protein IJ615_08330 [Bacteroidaceae bacterium]|nr:hypothetical protein [Bacteroidaceae bacterium]